MFSTKKQAANWLKKLKFPHMIGMIHMNDSKVPLGAHKDIHAQIGKGEMWKDMKPKKSGIKPFVDFAVEYQLPIILERVTLKNSGVEYELELIRTNFPEVD